LDTTTQAKLSFKAQLYRVNSLKECTKRHHGSENGPSQERISAKEELGQRSGLSVTSTRDLQKSTEAFGKATKIYEKNVYIPKQILIHHLLIRSAISLLFIMRLIRPLY
jgi:hypothetical protein